MRSKSMKRSWRQQPKEYGFEAYVELFKALAEQRHYDGKKDDIFDMSGTSLNPNPDKTLSS